jgi:DNA-binding GntR family transcriptional regulator
MPKERSAPRRPGLASIRPPFGAGGEALSLAEQIATQLAEAIIGDEYAPGARIHEVAVSERFQVSRGPVREALRILENEGLVTILPRRGAIVSKLSVSEVEDVFEIRAVLIGLAASRLARRGAEAAAVLRPHSDALADLVEGENGHDAYLAAVQQLNLLLCAETGSERLTAMVYSLFHQTLRYARLGLSTVERRRDSAANWSRLVDHIERGDAEAAASAARYLVSRSRETAIRLLQSEQAPEQET